jgi:hypothetical protein
VPRPKIVPNDQTSSKICGASASTQMAIAAELLRVADAVRPMVSAMQVSSVADYRGLSSFFGWNCNFRPSPA